MRWRDKVDEYWLEIVIIIVFLIFTLGNWFFYWLFSILYR